MTAKILIMESQEIYSGFFHEHRNWMRVVKTTVDDIMNKYFDRKGINIVNQNSDLCEPRL